MSSAIFHVSYYILTTFSKSFIITIKILNAIYNFHAILLSSICDPYEKSAPTLRRLGIPICQDTNTTSIHVHRCSSAPINDAGTTRGRELARFCS